MRNREATSRRSEGVTQRSKERRRDEGTPAGNNKGEEEEEDLLKRETLAQQRRFTHTHARTNTHQPRSRHMRQNKTGNLFIYLDRIQGRNSSSTHKRICP